MSGWRRIHPMDTQEHSSMAFEEDIFTADMLWSSSSLLLDDTAPTLPNDEDLLPWGGVSLFDPPSSEVAAMVPNAPPNSIQPSLLEGMEAFLPNYDPMFDYSDVDIDLALDWGHAEKPFNLDDSLSERRVCIDKNKPSLVPRVGVNLKNQTEKVRRITINQHQKQILTNWITNNSEPYPSKGEKANLATATGLSIDQVSGWFTRTRQRQLQRVQSNALALNLSGMSPSPSTYHRRMNGEAARMPKRVPSPALSDSLGNDRYPPSCFYFPRCTSLPPQSKEPFVNNSPKRTRSLPDIFTLDSIKNHASAMSQASQRQLSLDVAAPTHETGYLKGTKSDIEAQSSAPRAMQGLIYPSKTISNTIFVEAWVEDVARHMFGVVRDPLEITSQPSLLETRDNKARLLHRYEQRCERIGELSRSKDRTATEWTTNGGAPFPSTYPLMSPTEANNTDGGNTGGPIQSPDRTAVDTGTYTCTYGDCRLRFETLALLQGHKLGHEREWHRTTHNAKRMNYQCDIGTKGKQKRRRTEVEAPSLLPPADNEGSRCAGYQNQQGPSAPEIEDRPALVPIDSKANITPWTEVPLAGPPFTPEKLTASWRYPYTETAYDAMSSAPSSAGSNGSAASYRSFGPRKSRRAASSAGSNGSAASYMSFGPRKGRRVAFQRISYENFKFSVSSASPPASPPAFPSPAFTNCQENMAQEPGPSRKRKSDTVSDNSKNQMISDIGALENSSGNNNERRQINKNDGFASQGPAYQCTFCRRIFQRYYTWKRHEESAHIASYVWICRQDMFPADPTSCPVCASSSSGSDRMPPALCPHKFRECWQKPELDRTFYRRDTFQQHLYGVHFNGERVSHQIDKVVNHGRHVGADPSPSDLICHFCGFHAETREARFQHIRKHFENGETMNWWISGGPYVINIDGSTLVQSPAERRRANTLSNGQGKWVCRMPGCFDQFPRPSFEVDWTCTLCGKKFNCHDDQGIEVESRYYLYCLHKMTKCFTTPPPKLLSTAEDYVNHLLESHHADRGKWMHSLILSSFTPYL